MIQAGMLGHMQVDVQTLRQYHATGLGISAFTEHKLEVEYQECRYQDRYLVQSNMAWEHLQDIRA